MTDLSGLRQSSLSSVSAQGQALSRWEIFFDDDFTPDEDDLYGRGNTSCPVHRGFAMSPKKGSVLGISYTEMHTSVLSWKESVARKDCSFCAAAWTAFESFPPEDGWPPEKESVTVRVRRPALNVFALSLVVEPKDRKERDISAHYVMVESKLGDDEHTVELYHGPKPLAEPVEAAPNEGSTAEEVLRRRVSAVTGDHRSLSTVKGWLTNCVNRHEHCSTKLETLPSKLLHISDERVFLIDTALVNTLELRHKVQYAALSYCWGQANAGAITIKANYAQHQQAGLSTNDLPSTIRDAIKLTAALGLEYVWIDRLCIVQDDPHDWACEAGKMCDVYQNAILCISASRAQDVWHGLLGPQSYAKELTDGLVEYQCKGRRWYLGTQRKHVTSPDDEALPISKRAWTMQERHMSGRVLHILPTEMVWECDSLTQCECRQLTQGSDRWLASKHNVEDPGMLWSTIVTEYQRRQLTKPGDKLPALSGISTAFASQYNGSFVAGLWRSSLARQLCWLPPLAMSKYRGRLVDGESAATSRPASYLAPTWSWASIVGEIDYFRCYPRSTFTSALAISSIDVVPRNADYRYGPLADGSLHLEGYVVRVGIERLVFGLEDGTKATYDAMKDDAGNICAVQLDDRSGSQLEDVKELKCLLVGHVLYTQRDGTTTFTCNGDMPEPLATVCAQQKPGSIAQRRVEKGLAEASSFASWYREWRALNGILEGTASRSAFSLRKVWKRAPRPATGNQCPDGFGQKKFDSWYDLVESSELSHGRTPFMETPYTFYLLLRDSIRRPGAFERVACFHAGMNPDRRTVLKAMFRYSRKEALTIV